MPRAFGRIAVPGWRSTSSERTPNRDSRIDAVRPTGPPPTIRTGTSSMETSPDIVAPRQLRPNPIRRASCQDGAAGGVRRDGLADFAGEARQVVGDVAEGVFDDHARGGNNGRPRIPRSCRCRHAIAPRSAIRSAPPARPPTLAIARLWARSVASGSSSIIAASIAMLRPCSSDTNISVARCCKAWFSPIGLPNCWRVLRYSSVIACIVSIAPTASAAIAAMPASTTRSMTGNAPSSSPSTASAPTSTPLSVISAARAPSRSV